MRTGAQVRRGHDLDCFHNCHHDNCTCGELYFQVILLIQIWSVWRQGVGGYETGGGGFHDHNTAQKTAS